MSAPVVVDTTAGILNTRNVLVEKQCTMDKEYDCWLCHTNKLVDGIKIVVDCHTAYHVIMELYTPSPPPGSATGCSVISDLTEG